MQRILLIEDHASFRQTLAYVLDHDPEFGVVGQAGTLAEARRVWAEIRAGADIALVDLSLPDGSGIDLIPDMRTENPDFAALILTASLERTEIARAVEAGAAGVLHKSSGVDKIVGALRDIAEGRPLMSAQEIVELMRLAGQTREKEYEARMNAERLTPREKDVLQGLGEGLSNKEIARKLHISVETERSHMMSILNKIGAHSRLQALVFAARHDIVKLR